jgi:ribose transport system substrate-binding protein
VELDAASVDHLTYLTDADVESLAASDTVATLLPGVEFSTRQPYPDARRLIDAGARVALASDCNPGSSFTSSVPFCIAETTSIAEAAAKAGVKKFIKTNAQSTLAKQISDIQDLIAQGADVLIVAPLNSDGLKPALQAARKKNIPVITVDRKLNAKACSDYVSFLGSDFVEQGRRAADQLIAGTGGKGDIAILLGASGNGVTIDRTKGFVDQLKAKGPGLTVVAQQTGDFARDKGQSVTEQLLQAHPDITAIYAENDEMGLGAQAAIIAAGKTPGKDIQLYSIDGTRNAVEQIAAGAYNGVIESNPRFGPLAFATLSSFLAGDPVGQAS